MKINEDYLMIIATLFMVFHAIYRADRFHEVTALLYNPRWLINFAIVIIFGLYVTTASHENHRVKNALKKGILAFIIAVLAHLKMTIAPFWIVFVLSYYLEGWV